MIAEFTGEYKFLSNFSPSIMFIDNGEYSTVEHYYQAMKTEDMNQRRKIQFAHSPTKAKRLGRQCTIRSDWESIKINIMEKALRSKFSNGKLKEMLLATGNQELQEGNSWGDTFWGINLQNSHGKNNLGKLLMKIRDDLRK